MKHNILTIGILSAIFGTACTEKIDIELNEGENNRLVVEGYISTDTMQHSVRLTRSTSYFYNQPSAPEEGAIVTISDNEGNHFPLTYDGKTGNYLTSPDVFGVPGRTYTLNIKLKDGSEYEAVDELIEPNFFDTVYYEYTNLQYGVDIGAYYYWFYTTFTEKEFFDDKYLIYYYFNDSLWNPTFDDVLYASTASYMDGCGHFEDVLFSAEHEDSIPHNPHVRCDLVTISTGYYNFVTQLYSETVTQSGLFAGPPANICTNIINKDKEKPNGLGYFSARSYDKYEFDIKNDMKDGKPMKDWQKNDLKN
ncbi:MAG: DUF4249 domain-containing protein [Salinivirgaceae bacterium]|nr:DUF4249 domain-containing protein [Salinivirgaceae bacterium]